ncbi:MAG TPA: septal ring lytic transglycosylase RlpA family protein [Candidatus Binataceae bacterium]|nr:septal ring lytic transglycosylase RlpA family protein [Candidatus Binataceae bacterium]
MERKLNLVVLSARALVAGLFATVAMSCAPGARNSLPSPAAIAVVPSKVSARPAKVVMASWYGPGFAGRRTASGERFDPSRLTAASPTLPLGSKVLVTNLSNGHSVAVRINDCGPYVHGRQLDLSRQAARRLAMIHKGVSPVSVRVIATPAHPEVCGFPRRKIRHRRSRESYARLIYARQASEIAGF